VRVRAYVFAVPPDTYSGDLDGLEVLVSLYDNGPPEVALRPTVAGFAVRVWGVPLELKQASTDEGGR
jgi:hypothetical protein